MNSITCFKVSAAGLCVQLESFPCSGYYVSTISNHHEVVDPLTSYRWKPRSSTSSFPLQRLRLIGVNLVTAVKEVISSSARNGKLKRTLNGCWHLLLSRLLTIPGPPAPHDLYRFISEFAPSELKKISYLEDHVLKSLFSVHRALERHFEVVCARSAIMQLDLGNCAVDESM